MTKTELNDIVNNAFDLTIVSSKTAENLDEVCNVLKNSKDIEKAVQLLYSIAVDTSRNAVLEILSDVLDVD